MQPLNQQRPLHIVLSSTDAGNVIYGLTLAATAAAIGTRVEVMVSMGATGYFAQNPAPDYLQGLKQTGIGGIPTLDELIHTCTECGVAFRICPMGLTYAGLAVTNLRSDIAFTQGGLVEFLRDSLSEGQLIAL
jgi:peroxiredoxin family protein